jgi:hypothetical protein
MQKFTSKLPTARTWLLALMIACATGSIGSASAQQSTSVLQAYDVELVIFRTLGSGATPEQWSLEAAAAGHRLAIPEDEPSPFEGAAQPAPTTESFPALPAAKFKLTAVEETLRRSRNFQPLAHIGWTQPGFARNTAKFLSINGMVPAASGLMGQVALSRGRYLHLTLDLVYDAASEGGQRYVLRQTRRMRSNERHYIDHPRFGVIAVITPTTP